MELTTKFPLSIAIERLFMMSKIQNLNGTHNMEDYLALRNLLFMMSKIQNLNGTHNLFLIEFFFLQVVYDVKDTKFEWNSQLFCISLTNVLRCL